jgi:radical SAM superfamily enzyme YgiQ (UPF0313 family)
LKTVLVFPPSSDPAHPPLGIASLAGHLRPKGHDVDLVDLNVASLHHLLSKESIAACTLRLEERVRRLEKDPLLAARDHEEYSLALQHLLAAEFVHEHVEDALRRLRDRDTYADCTAYRREARIVRRAMELVSAAHYPVRWYPRGFSMEHLPTASREVLRALRDERQNLFLPFLRKAVEDIAARRPAVVGLSINYYCQLVPALTLATLVKERLPAALVAAGGGLVCFFDRKWEVLGRFSALVDAWIPYEGERPLQGLLEALAISGGVAHVPGVPGVLRFVDGAPVFGSPSCPPDPDELPPPDFRGLPLGSYLSPEPILPLLASRGCYWGRCGFCAHGRLYRQSFRRREGSRVVAEMEEQHRRHGARTFYFSDEAIPPRTAREIAAQIERRGLPFSWFGEMRMEPCLEPRLLRTLGSGGCRMLMFGLESASRRVLDCMGKGIAPAGASSVLRACHESGVKAFVMFMVGFPTETESEAWSTVEFVEEHASLIEGVAFTNFILVQGAPAHREPERYGLTHVSEYPGEDLKIYSRYSVSEGLSAAQAVRVLEVARERPRMRGLVDPDLQSRSHLVFLPRRREEATVLGPTAPEAPLAFCPRRVEGLVARTCSFDLEEIEARRREDGGIGAAVGWRRASYVYDPSADRLVEVGRDGIALLRCCNGRRTLQEILDGIAAGARSPATQFYEEMASAGMIRWEARR